ncbi:MAG TPA: hypothetical protein VLH60_05345 [Sedimentisphaerales bacterium]|nr:hypothetical protein [Sedimentisphaerales bacterium]
MNKLPTSVIKHDVVRIAGKVRLDSALPRPAQAAAAAAQRPEAGGSASARIAKTGPDHVVIEVTCACGEKILLRCDN